MPRPEVKIKSTMTSLKLLSAIALAFTPTCDAFFRNLMIGDTAMARVDPIVNRGEAAMHVHHLTGGGSLDFESTGDSLSGSSCTNSLITVDKSAYWAPWLYFQHENGTFQPVELALGLTAYYKYEKRGNTGGDVQYSVFPKGLKMIAGDTNKRSWTGPWPVPEESLWGPDDTKQDALMAKAMGFNCMNYEPGKNEPSFAFPYLRNKDFLDQNCINGVRAEIIFPSCWDGENLDSDDHQSHVKYPTLIQDGVCPTTHPIYLPILFYETIWQTNAFSDVPGQFVFSNGDPTGYGYHADFIAAWDDGIQEAVSASSQCTYIGSSGEIGDCPVFDGKTQTQAEARTCKLTLDSSIANEETDGFLETLPGDVKVKGVRHDPGSPSGDDGASSESYAPTASIPKSRSSAEATYTDAATTGYYHSAATDAAPLPSTMVTSYNGVVAAAADTPSLSTTTYTSGKYVVEMVIVQETTTVTATGKPSMTNTVVVPDYRKRDHLRRHVHYHDHI